MAEDEELPEEPVRGSFWSGTITFGLVSVPVDLYPATRGSGGVSLRMVAKDGTPLERRYYCSKDGKKLEWEDLVSGYEVEDGEYVVVTDDELERLEPDKTRDIDLRQFVPASALDPIFFERAYYLTPGGNSTKAYRLLAATMEETERAGIATFVMRGKEYLVAIVAENGILRAETLRFADEVRTPKDVGLPKPKRASAPTVKKIEKAMASLTEKSLDEKELVDESTKRLLALVAKKEKAGEVIKGKAEDDEPSSEGIIDLMEVLKQSLRSGSASKSTGHKSTASKTSRKKATGRARKGAKKSARKTTRKRRAA